MNGQWHRACAIGELAPGRVTVRTVAGRGVAICRVTEGVFAVEDRCTHAETRMSEGRLRGCRLTCPLHGASFDVRDGRVLGGPARDPLASFPVRIESGNVELWMPEPSRPA
jgi:nitrite reductase/ring-hydroxylating ferredoxin subunit